MNIKKILNHRRFHTKQTFTILSLLLTTLLLFSPITPLFNTVSPFVSVLDADATLISVDGRILTADKAGDISDWIEIAKYDKYSLIVRKNYINVYAGGQSNCYNDATWQSCFYGTNNNYATTVSGSYCNVRNHINAWFTATAPGLYVDNLNASARLHEYVVGNNAIATRGGVATEAAMTNGLSYPNPDNTQSRYVFSSLPKRLNIYIVYT